MICLDVLCTSRLVPFTRKHNDESVGVKSITVHEGRQGRSLYVCFSFRVRSPWAYTQVPLSMFGLILLRGGVTNVLRYGELHEALVSHMTHHIKSP